MNAHSFPMPVIPGAKRQETAAPAPRQSIATIAPAPLQSEANAAQIIYIDLDFPDWMVDAHPKADVIALGQANVERKIRAASPYDNEDRGWW